MCLRATAIVTTITKFFESINNLFSQLFLLFSFITRIFPNMNKNASGSKHGAEQSGESRGPRRLNEDDSSSERSDAPETSAETSLGLTDSLSNANSSSTFISNFSSTHYSLGGKTAKTGVNSGISAESRPKRKADDVVVLKNKRKTILDNEVVSMAKQNIWPGSQKPPKYDGLSEVDDYVEGARFRIRRIPAHEPPSEIVAWLLIGITGAARDAIRGSIGSINNPEKLFELLIKECKPKGWKHNTLQNIIQKKNETVSTFASRIKHQLSQMKLQPELYNEYFVNQLIKGAKQEISTALKALHRRTETAAFEWAEGIELDLTAEASESSESSAKPKASESNAAKLNLLMATDSVYKQNFVTHDALDSKINSIQTELQDMKQEILNAISYQLRQPNNQDTQSSRPFQQDRSSASPNNFNEGDSSSNSSRQVSLNSKVAVSNPRVSQQ